MTLQHTPYLLKVLSGSNAGALVRLKVGDVVIGKSMSSDIILHDEAIADSHVKLRVDEESILMEILARPVRVDNQELQANEYALQPYQVVTVGGIDFFIADVRKPGRRGAASPGQNGARFAAGVGVAPDGRSPSQGEAGAAFYESVDVPMTSVVKRRNSWGWPLFWLGLGLLLLANLLFFRPYLTGLAEMFGLKASVKQRAESLLEKLQAEDLAVNNDPNGRVSITGYVETREEKRDLMNRLAISGEDVNYRVWARDELVMNAERVARALGQPDLRFSNLTEGKLAATGYVSNEADWVRIKTNIMGDVSGIQSIEDKGVQTLLKRKEALVQFIEKKGLSSRVKVTLVEDKIKVDGELTKSELNRWGDLYKEFLELYGDGPAIVESLYDAKDRLKLAIRSVSVGEVPFLVSKDGKKYMEGSSLGGNYFIKKITPDHVLLSNNGIEIPIYYGVEDK